MHGRPTSVRWKEAGPTTSPNERRLAKPTARRYRWPAMLTASAAPYIRTVPLLGHLFLPLATVLPSVVRSRVFCQTQFAGSILGAYGRMSDSTSTNLPHGPTPRYRRLEYRTPRLRSQS